MKYGIVGLLVFLGLSLIAIGVIGLSTGGVCRAPKVMDQLKTDKL